MANLLFAQAPRSNRAVVVEHAVPFGTITGKLLLPGNSLVFYDDQRPENSFVVARSAIESLTAEGPMITLQSRETVKTRSGEVRRLSFRVTPDGDPAPVTGWFASTVAPGPALTATPTPAAAAKPGEAVSYPVVQDKRIGSSTGRLLVTDLTAFLPPKILTQIAPADCPAPFSVPFL